MANKPKTQTNEGLIILEIPHRLPATAWYAVDEADFIKSVEATYGQHVTIHETHTRADSIPEEYIALLNEHGSIIEVNEGNDTEYIAPDEAPTRFEAYQSYNAHDLQIQRVMTFAEAREYDGANAHLVKHVLKQSTH